MDYLHNSHYLITLDNDSLQKIIQYVPKKDFPKIARTCHDLWNALDWQMATHFHFPRKVTLDFPICPQPQLDFTSYIPSLHRSKKAGYDSMIEVQRNDAWRRRFNQLTRTVHVQTELSKAAVNHILYPIIASGKQEEDRLAIREEYIQKQIYLCKRRCKLITKTIVCTSAIVLVALVSFGYNRL